MSALIERDKIDLTPAPVVPASETAAILQLITHAASNPAVDLDKMERLFAMRESVLARNAEVAFNVAMSQAQAEMGRVSADANNPQTRSRYATYAQLDRHLRPIYAKHGFSLSFDEADSPKAEHVRVICHVAHKDGHTRIYHRDMPADGKGAKGGDVMTKTHATGAAQSYGMRYLLRGIFNVAVGEEDRDGNEPQGGGAAINEAQLEELRDLIEEVGADVRKFCAYLKVDGLAQIPASQFARAKQALETKRKRGQA